MAGQCDYPYRASLPRGTFKLIEGWGPVEGGIPNNNCTLCYSRLLNLTTIAWGCVDHSTIVSPEEKRKKELIKFHLTLLPVYLIPFIIVSFILFILIYSFIDNFVVEWYKSLKRFIKSKWQQQTRQQPTSTPVVSRPTTVPPVTPPPSAYTSPLSNLTPMRLFETKDQCLSYLREHVVNAEDPISLEKFEDMTLNVLQNMVIFERHAYDPRHLEQFWRDKHVRKLPLNPGRVATNHELHMVIEASRRIADSNIV